MTKHLKIDKKTTDAIIDLLRSTEHRVFKRSELEKLFAKSGKKWTLPPNYNFAKILEFLINETTIKSIELEFPSRKETRYSLPDASIYELSLSLRPNAFFSHYTAMRLHNLTEQLPRTIYVNHEQSPKPSNPSSLTQERIDFAFSHKQRTTSNVARYDKYKICLLNSKHTNRAGVISIHGDSDEILDVTNIERTMIDIIVRPDYSGGIFEILKAYKSAAGKISINRLCAILKNMNHIYPYHQAIGFCLEKTGSYDRSQLKMLRDMGMDFDFYLTYNIKEIDYNKYWKLFIPKGL